MTYMGIHRRAEQTLEQTQPRETAGVRKPGL